MRSARHRDVRRLLSAVLVAAMTALLGWQVYRQWSQGDDFPQIAARGAAGPYRLLVGTIPGDLSTRAAHIAIDVRDMRTGRGAPDVRVAVSAVNLEGRRLGPIVARNGGMDRQYYDARVAFPATGPWRVRVRVQGAAGAGSLEVPLTVAAPTIPWVLILRWLIPSGLLLAAIGYTRRERRPLALPGESVSDRARSGGPAGAHR
ncbi:MAG: hypothetical protein B7Z66_06460 [Chromatiales bacterium 21-64-14]|nr:MAG: hypothetical protein B7Z66_06460 [Chromatiales bacterium 21-64-14]HQU16941.1 hypothetical protein [Gammaproteobacteria bacterium]